MNNDIITLLVLLFSAFLVIRGLDVSVKYAEFISVAEIIAIFVSSATLLLGAHPTYNFSIPSNPFLVVLYAIGMPIGYGNLNPMSEDIKNAKKIVGIVTVIVILLGGLLSALLFYAVALYGTDLIEILLSKVGFIFPYLIFSALNGGILGGIAYIIAMSRILYAMSLKNFMPSMISLIKYGRPFNAEIISLAIYAVALFLMTHFAGLYTTFVVLGGLAVLSHLTLSLSANLSLFRIVLKKITKRKKEIALAFSSILLSLIVLVYSMEENEPIIDYIFLLWIITGFIYAEILEMFSGE